MLSTLAALALVVPLAAIAAILWARNVPRHADRADPSRFSAVRSSADAQALAHSLLKQMSLEEKLSQLSGDLRLLPFCLRYGVGLLGTRGVPLIYSGRNKRLGIPPLAFSDGPRGVNVGKGRTCFPVTMARGASWDVDLERRVGEAMGRELRAIGANYSGAVCVNLLRHPGWGRAQETYGEDPHHLGTMGVALTRGIQTHHVMACVKHFALNSIECARFYVDVQVDERSLREVYLPHFKRIVQQGQVASVMSAYNRFRGEYCGHSKTLLTDILRDEWGFEGFVTSDWLHGVRDGVAGLRAGMDVEMPAANRYGKKLGAALDANEVSTALVDTSAQRVLATRMRFALQPETGAYPASLVACDDHIQLAREVAEQSAVLLKNEEVLPLQVAETTTVAVIGRLAAVPNTGDRGSSHVHAPYVVSPADGLAAYLTEHGGEILVETGEDLDDAAAAARSADAVVIVVGTTHHDEGEYFVLNPDSRQDAWRPSFFGGGGDRSDLRLRPEDRALIKAIGTIHPKTVVVAVAGSAIDVSDWLDSVPALLMPFYAGMEGGRALARLLFGEVCPSGKLPFTIAADQADYPEFSPFAETADYSGGHGYTRFEAEGLPVAFPFGHGLSYTRFAYSDLVVQTPEVKPDGALDVSVDVTNEGASAGREVVQLYVSFPHTEVARPPKLLRAFRKVLLQPAEVKRVTLTVPAEDLAWYDPEARAWRLEPVVHGVHVGGSSRTEELLSATFTVDPEAGELL